MSKRHTVFKSGAIPEPYLVVELPGFNVWFYADRGRFEFLYQDSSNGTWNPTKRFRVPTRTIRAALRLMDSVKK